MVFYCRCLAQPAVSATKDIQTHYEVLGLTSNASQTQIRNAYLELSKQVFPVADRHNSVY